MSDAYQVDHPEVAWRDITALRNLLAHHDHRIDPDQVWQIATAAVPGLTDHLRA